MTVLEAGPQPADLLREVHRLACAATDCVLFDSMDAMVQTWGVPRTRDFFARCCPMLLEFGAIAYWSMTARETPVGHPGDRPRRHPVRAPRRRSQRARGQGRGPRRHRPGSVLHWHQESGRAVLEPAELSGRVAASLRTVRHARKLSQHDLGTLRG